MMAYDALSFDKRAAVFSAGQVEHAERLCVEVALAATGAGAAVRMKSRVEEPVLEHGRVVGVRYATRPPLACMRCADT